MEELQDYYFNEDGLMVFTESYHLKRGYCCKNKCLHCPWSYGKKDREASISKTMTQNNNDGTSERT